MGGRRIERRQKELRCRREINGKQGGTVAMFRVTAAARSTLTDGAESITGARVSKELKGKIISPVSKASWNQFNNSIELLSKGE